jgi:hypothetical protein
VLLYQEEKDVAVQGGSQVGDSASIWCWKQYKMYHAVAVQLRIRKLKRIEAWA